MKLLGYGKDKGAADTLDVSPGHNSHADDGHTDEILPLRGEASRWRLRHIDELALRGVTFNGVDQGYRLEVAEDDAPEPLERSDVFRTRNPTWALHRRWPEKKTHARFQLRAVAATAAGAVLWHTAVCLADFEPFCPDLEKFGHLPPSGEPLLKMGKRWHASTSALVGVPNCVPAAPSGKDARMRTGAAKKAVIHASEICNAGERISQMLGRLKVLQSQIAQLRDSMQDPLERHFELSNRRAKRNDCEKRVSALRNEVANKTKHVALLRTRLEDARNEQAATLERKREQLSHAQNDHQQVASELDTTRHGLRIMWRQLRCRQMRMLHDVCQVYPIENCGRYWTIRGLCIVNVETLAHQDLREEETVSTALGYLAHLLVTLAGILEVPLRIWVHQAGCSRSFLSDPHEVSDGSASPREWPLFYGKNLEKSRFEKALRLLRDGMHHFLYSRGYFDERRMCKGNLLECAELILKKEMCGIDS